MKTLTLRAKTDSEGRLTIEIPDGEENTEYEVVIVLQATTPVAESGTGEENDLPPLGSPMRLLYEAQRANIQLERDIDSDEMRRILNDDFADHLLRYEKDEPNE